jgi:hypothetical protein
MVRYFEPENLEIPGLVLAHHPGMTTPSQIAGGSAVPLNPVAST